MWVIQGVERVGAGLLFCHDQTGRYSGMPP
jgi:hypothetical protein